jgi:hypothetical protein
MSKEGAAEDNSVSHMDTEAAKPENMASQSPGSTSQETLGKEQKQDAHDGGANADTSPENSEADGQDFADTQGPQTLDTDDKVTDKGNIGPQRGQAITQEQKMARADRLADSILTVLENTFSKSAKECGCEGECECESESDDGEYGDDYADAMYTEEDKEAAAQFDKLASVAQNAAQDYYEGFLLGMLKRAQDEADLRAAGIPDAVLEKVGGIEGLLDKVAMADPTAVLPEEALAAEAPVEGGVPGGGGEDLDAIAGELDAAGVTPEDLQAAMEDVAALQEAGVAPEEIEQALSELGAEEGAGLEGGAPEAAPMEAIPAEALKEASVQRARIDQIKAYLSR